MQEGGELTDFSVTAEQWGSFLCTIFDEWVHHDVGEYYIQLFDATLANWVGVAPGICTMAKECGHAGVMEYKWVTSTRAITSFTQNINLGT